MEESTLWTLALEELDPVINRLISAEESRQKEKIILIPSESLTPQAVREALGSVLTSIYAEGFPSEEMLRLPEGRLADFAEQLAHFRRYADRRFYKGVEYADIVESIACRRAAEAFANDLVPASDIYACVQPLSGAAANMAIYDALLEPGDTLMAMALTQGGHLSHGSPFHQSGRRFNVVYYGVDEKTEKLDYDRIEDLAKKHHPKMIIAGYTSYPWAPDWEAFRKIADEVGAFLMADISHVAGLAIAGAYPNPVGWADVVMFTTHKTLLGPRGAVILSTDPEIAKAIERAIFPGAQGGPHVNKFAAIAVALSLARTDFYRRLQHRIVENAQALARALSERGIRVAYGGTDTHLLVIDLRPVRTPNGQPLMGEVAARILDLAGLVANKNTIPGDRSAADARGIRYGTPWVTQRGMGATEMEEIADITAHILGSIHPFYCPSLFKLRPRGGIPLSVLAEARDRVRELASRFFPAEGEKGNKPPAPAALLVRSWRADHLLHEATTSHILALEPGQATRTLFLDRDGKLLAEAIVGRLPDDDLGRVRFVVRTPDPTTLKEWLIALSDGYGIFDPEDLYRKVQGPAVVEELSEGELGELLKSVGEPELAGMAFRKTPFLGLSGEAPALFESHPELFAPKKPFFIGQHTISLEEEKTRYRPQAPEGELRRTVLYDVHRELGARMAEFAGYEMPLWYTSALEEHRAVRERAGLFDLGHMGVFEVAGRYSESFLNLVTSNYAGKLQPGQSQYAFLLDPDGQVIDDLLVYRLSRDRFLLVVNAANEAADWDWLNAVNSGKALIDPQRPWVEPDGPVELTNLKEAESGWLDIALQGPVSRAVLLKLLGPRDQRRLVALRRTEFLELELAGKEVICARTGYTGEPVGYELYVHPGDAEAIWQAILESGKDLGVKPCGLAARDSLRTEAGLPLYGHELAGENGILPHEAGLALFVKLHKPFFIGRAATLRAVADWQREIVRFKIPAGARPVRAGAQVVDKNGTLIGVVTSSVVLEDRQVGMALLWKRGVRKGTQLGFVLGALPKGEVKLGSRLPTVVWGETLSRFLRRKAPLRPRSA